MALAKNAFYLLRLGGAQAFGQGLKELPGDSAVAFHQRAELPERQPVAGQVGGRAHRGGAGATVDQGDLAEVVARAEGGKVEALARDRSLPGVDEEEGGASRALHDDGLALGKAAFLEQPGDLLGLSAVHIGEEPGALKGGNGVARRRAGRWGIADLLPGGNGAALKEVERPILVCPFDVAPRAVGLLTLEGELAQGRELGVVEADRIYLKLYPIPRAISPRPHLAVHFFLLLACATGEGVAIPKVSRPHGYSGVRGLMCGTIQGAIRNTRQGEL